MAEQNERERPTQRKPNNSYQNKNYQHGLRPNVGKALHNFGVRDLRELLDRKHEGHSRVEGNGPPPDPKHGFLRDPLRENELSTQDNKINQKSYGKPSHHQHIDGHRQRENINFGNRGHRETRDSRHRKQQENEHIKDPINIKVQFLASTGERTCKMDENTKISDIKHVPDFKLERSESDRGGRGRGRGRGFVRGRGEFRGRGGSRGRSRGQYRGNPRQRQHRSGETDKNSNPNNAVVQEEGSEENWDDNDATTSSSAVADNNVNVESYREEEEYNPENDYDGDEEETNFHQTKEFKAIVIENVESNDDRNQNIEKESNNDENCDEEEPNIKTDEKQAKLEEIKGEK